MCRFIFATAFVLMALVSARLDDKLCSVWAMHGPDTFGDCAPDSFQQGDFCCQKDLDCNYLNDYLDAWNGLWKSGTCASQGYRVKKNVMYYRSYPYVGQLPDIAFAKHTAESSEEAAPQVHHANVGKATNGTPGERSPEPYLEVGADMWTSNQRLQPGSKPVPRTVVKVSSISECRQKCVDSARQTGSSCQYFACERPSCQTCVFNLMPQNQADGHEYAYGFNLYTPCRLGSFWNGTDCQKWERPNFEQEFYIKYIYYDDSSCRKERNVISNLIHKNDKCKYNPFKKYLEDLLICTSEGTIVSYSYQRQTVFSMKDRRNMSSWQEHRCDSTPPAKRSIPEYSTCKKDCVNYEPNFGCLEWAYLKASCYPANHQGSSMMVV